MAAEPTVVFFPEGAYGPTNNCVGIGQVLQSRGVRVVFVIEESFAGTLEARGFEERLMRLGPPPEVEEAPGQFWKDFIAATSPEFRKPTIEQLETFIAPTMGALVDGARYVEERLCEIIDELQPDIVVEDNVCTFPALPARAKRWARIVSCNPAEILDPAVPPVFSGYAAGDRTGWDEFWAAYDRHLGPLWAGFNEFCQERGTPALEPRSFIHESPDLNLYLYPAEADYARERPLGPTWHRIDTCVREEAGEAELPDEIRHGDGSLVYLSLGSLGSADVGLMQRLCDALADTAAPLHRLEGPSGGRDHPARSPVGRGVPAAAAADAALRPRHHARRQQHDHRVLPPRAADDHAAPVLGPVRQRAARRRARLRPLPGDLRVGAGGTHERDRFRAQEH